MADVFSAESRLIHAGTERAVGVPATPPLALMLALAIAGYLASHPRVSTVHYPGVDGPGVDKATSELARRQMPDGFGPLLSFEVRPDSADAADLITDIDHALEVL
jgi:cystathionine beta-lyase/cystathionine gamma-synthase